LTVYQAKYHVVTNPVKLAELWFWRINLSDRWLSTIPFFKFADAQVKS